MSNGRGYAKPVGRGARVGAGVLVGRGPGVDGADIGGLEPGAEEGCSDAEGPTAVVGEGSGETLAAGAGLALGSPLAAGSGEAGATDGAGSSDAVGLAWPEGELADGAADAAPVIGPVEVRGLSVARATPPEEGTRPPTVRATLTRIRLSIPRAMTRRARRAVDIVDPDFLPHLRGHSGFARWYNGGCPAAIIGVTGPGRAAPRPVVRSGPVRHPCGSRRGPAGRPATSRKSRPQQP